MPDDVVRPVLHHAPRRPPWRAHAALVTLDLRGVVRDDVLLTNLLVSALVAAVLTGLGAAFGEDPAWRAWMPACLSLAIVTGPPSWGFLFGLLMVEEHETAVRRALAVTPMPLAAGLLTRVATSFVLVFLWSSLSLAAMNATWHAVPFTRVVSVEGLGFLAASSLGAPLTALLVATWATNKIEALAVFKGINFVVLAPLAIFALPAASWLRVPLFLSPSAWGVAAFEALREGRPALGLVAIWAVVMLVGLIVTLRAFARRHMGDT